MIVIDIIPLNNKKYKIVCDGTVFSLYKNDIRNFNLESGKEIDELLLDAIYDLLYKKGKDRALYLLESMDKTEYQIRQKLIQGYYPEEVTERIIAFLKKYGFVNDDEYARKYIDMYINVKSIRIIENDMFKKGIKRDIYEKYLVKDEENELYQIEALLKKRKYDLYKDNIKEVNKIINYILRRGYSYDTIQKAIRRVE